MSGRSMTVVFDDDSSKQFQLGKEPSSWIKKFVEGKYDKPVIVHVAWTKSSLTGVTHKNYYQAFNAPGWKARIVQCGADTIVEIVDPSGKMKGFAVDLQTSLGIDMAQFIHAVQAGGWEYYEEVLKVIGMLDGIPGHSEISTVIQVLFKARTKTEQGGPNSRKMVVAMLDAAMNALKRIDLREHARKKINP